MSAIDAEFCIPDSSAVTLAEFHFEDGTPMEIGTPRGDAPLMQAEFPVLIAAFGQQASRPSDRDIANKTAIPSRS